MRDNTTFYRIGFAGGRWQLIDKLKYRANLVMKLYELTCDENEKKELEGWYSELMIEALDLKKEAV